MLILENSVKKSAGSQHLFNLLVYCSQTCHCLTNLLNTRSSLLMSVLENRAKTTAGAQQIKLLVDRYQICYCFANFTEQE